MFYTVYKTTNLVNGKIYIGSHKTKDLDDGYLGSGKYLWHAINKHGVENFKKEILFVFDNPEEMYAKEAELVNEDFLAEENTYNLKVGGFGGFDYVNSIRDHKEHSLKISKKRNYQDPLYKNRQSVGISKAKLGVPHPRNWRTLTTHKEETKKKISRSMCGKQTGEKNSQFGKYWISHDIAGTKKCFVDEYPLYYEQGWRKGRCWLG